MGEEALASQGKEDSVLKQFGKEVCDFSSQYGSETSISYTAGNLAGPSNIYPKYGDFNLAFVLRTYGPWWETAPSVEQSFGKTPSTFISQDYVEVVYETPVYPTKLEILETYHPGGVVKVVACDTSTSVDQDQTKIYRWFTLWSGEPSQPISHSRIFSPPLRPCPFRANVIRLEFNHQLSGYYLELDCVILYGGTSHVSPREPTISHGPSGDSTSSRRGKADSIRELQRRLQQASIQDQADPPPVMTNGCFDTLPEEVIQLILSHLDIPALCSLARVSRLFSKHCYDPLQYVELNLEPYWDKVNNAALSGLTQQCQNVQKLNLSWCGGYSDISPPVFTKFVSSCCQNLVALRLACCRFVDNDCVKAVAMHCQQLQELGLQCNRKIDNIGFLQLTKLSALRRLNLYRTTVDVHSLVAITRCCPDLEHLNLGSCASCNNFDDVAMEIGLNCRKLKSLDIWRARTISQEGLTVIANNCSHLEELDAGWCPELYSGTGCFVELARKCPRLRKVFLTANRTVCDSDLFALAACCPNLEQLDILGTREVSAGAAQRILDQCKRLRFLDVSFCANITKATVEAWSAQHPQCSIKRSFQSQD